MNCTKCGSDNIRLFKVICDEGTSEEEIRAESTPKWNTKPFGAHGKQKIKGTRKTQTALAKRCSPPSNPESIISYLAAFPAMAIAFFIAFKIGLYINSFWVGLIAFAILVLGITIGITALWRNKLGGNSKIVSYKKSLHEWQHSWLCSKCGSVTLMLQQ